MRIGVILRLVPDLAGDIEFAEDGRRLDLEWMDVKLNEFDDQALEEAVLLKEQSGGSVVAIGIEGNGVDKMLQGALARGADEAVKIMSDSEEAPDSRAAAPLHAELARSLGLDLILTGVQAPDDVFGQLAPLLGATLGWRHASAIAGSRAVAGTIEVQQEYSGGISAVLALDLPAVLGVQAASRPPRYVSGSRLRQVMGTPIGRFEPSGTPAAGTSELTALRLPEATGGAEMINGAAADVAARMIEILRGRGMVKA